MILAKKKRDEEERAKRGLEIDFVKQIEMKRNASLSDDDFDSEVFAEYKNPEEGASPTKEVLDSS